MAVSLRPEQAALNRRNEAPSHHTSVDGTIEQITYLGNALVYRVVFEWMDMDVRAENRPGMAKAAVGDEVTVSWEPTAVAVVEN